VKRIPVYLLLILLGAISACTKKTESSEIIKIPYSDPTYTRLFYSNQNIFLDTYFTDQDNAIQLRSSNGNNAGGIAILKKSAGTDFQTIVSLPQMYEAGELTMADTKTGYFAGGSSLLQLYKTTDGGNTWANIYTAPFDILGLAAPDDHNVFLIAQSTLYKSADGGNTWNVSIPQNFNNPPNSVYFYNNTLGFVALYYGQMLKTTDGGQNWVQITLPTTYQISDVFFVNATNGFATAGGENYLFGTTDGGNTWTKVSQNTLINSGKVFFYPDGRGIIVVRGEHVLYSRDFGKTTKLFLDDVGGNTSANIQAGNDTTLMISCNKSIYKINFSKK
jgi:photosystem II stability/assembly factor-like uncharacterized protein